MGCRSISILGCGWLGFALAQKFVQLGFLVRGSTTSDDKIEELKKNKILPYLIEIPQASSFLISKQNQSFFDSNILFLNIPFKRNLKDPSIYKYQIEMKTTKKYWESD